VGMVKVVHSCGLYGCGYALQCCVGVEESAARCMRQERFDVEEEASHAVVVSAHGNHIQVLVVVVAECISLADHDSMIGLGREVVASVREG
jgi:hypothetical protein